VDLNAIQVQGCLGAQFFVCMRNVRLLWVDSMAKKRGSPPPVIQTDQECFRLTMHMNSAKTSRLFHWKTRVLISAPDARLNPKINADKPSQPVKPRFYAVSPNTRKILAVMEAELHTDRHKICLRGNFPRINSTNWCHENDLIDWISQEPTIGAKHSSGCYLDCKTAILQSR